MVIHHHSQKQKKRKFKLGIRLSHNIYFTFRRNWKTLPQSLLALPYVQWESCKSICSRLTSIAILNILLYLLQWLVSLLLLQRLSLTRPLNTRPRKVFFCLLKPEFSWTSINCSHGFLTRSDGAVPSSLNEGRRLKRKISNDVSFLIIWWQLILAHMSVVWAYVSLWLCIFVTLYPLCGFVSLYVGMFVARANKVEGTMSSCLGTNEILASI